MKVDKKSAEERLNGLGKYITSQKDLNFSRVGKHLESSRKRVWLICHKPTKVWDLRLGLVRDIANIQNEDFIDLIKKLIELDE